MSLPLLTRSLRGPQLSKTLRYSLTTTTRYQSTTTTTNNNTAKPAATTSTTSTAPKPTTTTSTSSTSTPKTTPTLKDLLDHPPSPANPTEDRIDWTRSFHGLSATPFPKECADILLAPTDPEEVEIKPDGILYLPEIKYRRILNKAFGPGGWGLVPRSESIVTPKMVTREYALVCNGRLVFSTFPGGE